MNTRSLFAFFVIALLFALLLSLPSSLATRFEGPDSCDDGTPAEVCSRTQPFQCIYFDHIESDGLISRFQTLEPNCFMCGCLNGKCLIDGTCLPEEGEAYMEVQTPKIRYSLFEPVTLTNPDNIILVQKELQRGLLKSAIIPLPTSLQSNPGLKAARVGESLLDTSKLPYHGYIVELTSEPLLIFKKRLQETQSSRASSTGLASQAMMRQLQQAYITGYAKALKTTRERIVSNLLRLPAGPTGGAIADKAKVLGEYKLVFNGLALEISDDQAKELLKDPSVKAIHKNYPVFGLLGQSVQQIGAPAAVRPNGTRLTGKGIRIAVLDTGVDYTHPDLGGCSAEQFLNKKCPKVIGGYDFIRKDPDPMDENGHGTHVAAIAAGNGILQGVAFDAEILAYRVLDAFSQGEDAQILSGIEAALDPNGDGFLEDRAHIISMSLGKPVPYSDDPLAIAVNNAVRAGAVVIVSAGNDGPDGDTISSPGTAELAITVGASCTENLLLTDPDCMGKTPRVAEFSSRGPAFQYNKPDVLAPGVSICAAKASKFNEEVPSCLDTEHVALSGTSMAAPHVAGAAALLLEQNPTYTPLEVKSLLRATATDFEYSRLIQGSGQIDLRRAAGTSTRAEVAQFTGLSEAMYTRDAAVSGDIGLYGWVNDSGRANFTLRLAQGRNPELGAFSDKGILLRFGGVRPIRDDLIAVMKTKEYPDGKHMLLLETQGGARTSKDIQYLTIDNTGIDLAFELNGSIYFFGRVNGTSIREYHILYRMERLFDQFKSAGMDYGDFTGEKDNLLATLNASLLSHSGPYTARLTVNYSNGIITEEDFLFAVPWNASKGLKLQPPLAPSSIDNAGSREITGILNITIYKIANNNATIFKSVVADSRKRTLLPKGSIKLYTLFGSFLTNETGLFSIEVAFTNTSNNKDIKKTVAFEVVDKTATLPASCSDRTEVGSCVSTNISLFCPLAGAGSPPIRNCKACGCPKGSACLNNKVCQEVRCKDNSLAGSCSTGTKGLLCTNEGILELDCFECGCPGGKICNRNTCLEDPVSISVPGYNIFKVNSQIPLTITSAAQEKTLLDLNTSKISLSFNTPSGKEGSVPLQPVDGSLNCQKKASNPASGQAGFPTCNFSFKSTSPFSLDEKGSYRFTVRAPDTFQLQNSTFTVESRAINLENYLILKDVQPYDFIQNNTLFGGRLGKATEWKVTYLNQTKAKDVLGKVYVETIIPESGAEGTLSTVLEKARSGGFVYEDRFGQTVLVSKDMGEISFVTTEGTITVSAKNADPNPILKEYINRFPSILTRGTEEFVIPLQKGWNHISSPLVPATKTIDKIFDPVRDAVVRVYGFDAGKQQFMVYHTDPSIPSNLQFFEEGKGYFVLASQPTIIRIVGSRGFQFGNQPELLPLFKVIPGWNLVSYHNTKPFPVKEGFRSVLPNVNSLYTLIDGRLEKVPIDEKAILIPGQGYWIHMKSNDVITP